MRKLLLLILIWLASADIAAAGALDPWATWSAAQPSTARQIPPMALVARGVGTNAYYVMEVDPATGNLPVSITTGITVDYSGAPGATAPTKAAYVGGTDGTNLRGVKTDSSGELQIDVLTLPATAATTTKQDTGNTSLASIDGKLATLGQKVMTGSVPVVISSDQSAVTVADGGGTITVDGTVAVSNFPATVDTNSGAAGASTPRAVLATRHEAAATPLSVRISNGSAFSTPDVAGRTYADSARNAYASVNVTTGAWVQLIASTAADINALTIFDSCGSTLELGTGALAAETRKLIIPPGGPDGLIPLYIPSGTRVSIKAISANCTSGEIDLTGLN